jgi:VWFA-related protein
MLRAYGALLLLCLPLCIRAQESVFRSETVLMEVEVRVTGRGGVPVKDLSPKDFRLYENGELQEIRAFERVDSAGSGEAYLRVAGQNGPDLGAAASETPADQLRRSLFLYIAARGRPPDRQSIADAIRKFLDEQLRPGVYVSMEGRPFTSNRAQLERDLAAMTGENLSAAGGMTDRIAMALEDESDPMVEEMSALNAVFGAAEGAPTLVEELYGALTFYRYIRLAQTLGGFPGKKAVVLFSAGMRIDDANLDLVSRFAAEAMKARVSFYTVDTRRLSVSPEYDAESSAAPSRLAVEAFQDEQDGLFTLAKSSGGKAIQNTNKLGEIFDAVLEDASEYYILGYYPKDLSRQGRFRKIRVEVDRERVRLDYRKGYYEEKEFQRMTDAEKRLELLQALELETAFTEAPLSAGFEFFRGEGEQTVLGYSVGLHPSSLPAERKGKNWEVDFSIVAQAMQAGDDHGTALEERRMRMQVPAGAYERMQSDPSARLQFVSQMLLPAGSYQWRVIVRDESTGKLGSYKALVTAPDFSAGHPASSLLITGRVEDRPKKKKKGQSEEPGPFDIETYRLSPDSDRIFRRGDPLYALYDVYGYRPDDLARPDNAKLALFRGKKRVKNIPVAAYRVAVDREASSVRYLTVLDTAKLEAGDYVLGALVPTGGKDEAGLVWRRFTVIAAQR